MSSPTSRHPECFDRGPVRIPPVVSAIEPPLKACGNDGTEAGGCLSTTPVFEDGAEIAKDIARPYKRFVVLVDLP